MFYLHSRTPLAIMHRDLKPANCLIVSCSLLLPPHTELLISGVAALSDFALVDSLATRAPRRTGLRVPTNADRTIAPTVNAAQAMSVRCGYAGRRISLGFSPPHSAGRRPEPKADRLWCDAEIR